MNKEQKVKGGRAPGKKDRPVEKEVEFPEHLSRVNYLAMDAFVSNLEDDMTHKVYSEAIT